MTGVFGTLSACPSTVMASPVGGAVGVEEALGFAYVGMVWGVNSLRGRPGRAWGGNVTGSLPVTARSMRTTHARSNRDTARAVEAASRQLIDTFVAYHD